MSEHGSKFKVWDKISQALNYTMYIKQTKDILKFVAKELRNFSKFRSRPPF